MNDIIEVLDKLNYSNSIQKDIREQNKEVIALLKQIIVELQTLESTLP